MAAGRASAATWSNVPTSADFTAIKRYSLTVVSSIAAVKSTCKSSPLALSAISVPTISDDGEAEAPPPPTSPARIEAPMFVS